MMLPRYNFPAIGGEGKGFSQTADAMKGADRFCLRGALEPFDAAV